MTRELLALTEEQVDFLIQSLDAYHREYGAEGLFRESGRVESLLEGFRHFLEHFLDGGESCREHVGRLANDYFEARIPFVLLMGAFNRLKEQLIRVVASNMDDPLRHFTRIDHLFERAKRETAHAYLRLEADVPLDLPALLVRDKLLIRHAVTWLESVRRAVGGDLNDFPLETPEQSAFVEALRYPESMMICLDLKLCDQINEQHRVILQEGSLLYAMLGAQRYEQAYIAYQELQKKVLALINLLSVLYFEGETNRVNRFFSFLQAALFLPGRKFLCVMNLRNLGRINKLYGNAQGDRGLAFVEQALRREFENNRSWMLYTQGIAGDFYLFGHSIEPGHLVAVCDRMAQEIRAENDLPFDIEIQQHGIELTGLKELTSEDMRLVVQYLSENLVRGRTEIEADSDAAKSMVEWLRERYQRSLDLHARVEDDSVEIFVQPLVALDDSRALHAFEVLGRFREGEGFVSASMFIEDLSAMDLAHRFDLRVLQRIVEQADLLSQITSRLFVNVYATSLETSEYIDALIAAVEGPLRDFDVVVELTEHVLLERRELITQLHREHGLCFAIDDFGTGYSTLQLVIELAMEGSIRYLKLDGSLTRKVTTHPASERIMHITHQMAAELGLKTVVEVIEHPSQLEKLQGLGMDIGQGYLLGVPDTARVWLGKFNYLEARAGSNASSPFTL